MVWWSVFALFFLIELVWRRGYALWLALITGLNAIVLPPLSFKVTLPLFVILSGVAVVLWHYYYRRPLQYAEQHPQQRQARQYLHTIFCLSQAIKNGQGRQLIDDSYWYLKCDQDLVVGSAVKVKTVQGIFLHVIPQE